MEKENVLKMRGYQNASETRLQEKKQQQFALLSSAITEGVDSGITNDFDPKKHLAALKVAKKMKG